jgi:hypothetical protein
MTWSIIQAILSIVGSVTGPWSLIRSYWMSRSDLMVTQKDDPGYNKILGSGIGFGANDPVLITLLVSNKSAQPNSVLKYEATALFPDGSKESVSVEQGEIVENGNVLGKHCVTPLNLPPHSTTEANLVFLLPTRRFGESIKITVVLVDMYGKRREIPCAVPNVFPRLPLGLD